MLSSNETSSAENNTSQGTMTDANFEHNMEGNTGRALLESNNNETIKINKLYSELAHDQMDISQALIDKAKDGDGNTIYYIGSLYHHRQLYKKAWKWLRLAAEKNNRGALYMIGLMYENGNGVESDVLESLSWYLKAAKLGDLSSCICIASLFENGNTLAIDYQRAADWYIQGYGDVPEGVKYTNITQQEKTMEELIIETMQFLEQEREKRWRIKMDELEIENQKLIEELLQARDIITDMCTNQHRAFSSNVNRTYDY